MDPQALIVAMWEICKDIPGLENRRSAQRGFKNAMIDILKGEGYFVCDGRDELRHLAYVETDLVEPEDEI